MRVRSFHAPSAAEALQRARSEMGDGAYVLATKPHARGVELVVVDGIAPRGSREIEALRAEVRALKDRWTSSPAAVPEGLEDLHARITGVGLSSDLCSSLMSAAGNHRGLAALEAASNEIVRKVSILAPRSPHPDGPRIVALVGPTGVGKTTTIAKLAGRLVHQANRRVALFSLDTYRVGAVEQLRAYADLLASPFEVAFTPADLVRGVERVKDRDVVLVDTTGRSPADVDHLSQLASTLKLVDRLEVLLVLPATASQPALATAIDRFAACAPTGLVVTKLDESPHCGPVFSLAIERRLPLAFLCAGQEVPGDLERASASRVAQLLLSAGAKRNGAAA